MWIEANGKDMITMNRRLNISNTGIKHIEKSINAVLGSDKEKLLNKDAKVYITYNGETVEAWLIDFYTARSDDDEARIHERLEGSTDT